MSEQTCPQALTGELVLLKENPASYLLADAERALDSARFARDRAEADDEATFSRSAVRDYFAALEGFINFVYVYSDVEQGGWEKWSTTNKWLRAAEVCLPGHGAILDAHDFVLYRPGDPIEPFGADYELVKRFDELRQVRNAMTHAQPVFTMLPEDRVDAHFANAEYYPVTGLPKRLTDFRVEHAETAEVIFYAMITRLDVCLKGMVAHLVRAPALYERLVEDDSAPFFDDIA